jgi:hypothetical protein
MWNLLRNYFVNIPKAFSADFANKKNFPVDYVFSRKFTGN